MLSSWAYLSLTIYASFYQKLETIHFQWSKHPQKLFFISGIKALRTWIFNTFLMTIIANGSCLFLLIREIFAPTNSSLIFLIIQIVISGVASFWLFSSLCCFHFGEDFVIAWNYIKAKAQQISLSKKGTTLQTLKFSVIVN